jgi:hypothetical protein
MYNFFKNQKLKGGFRNENDPNQKVGLNDPGRLRSLYGSCHAGTCAGEKEGET